MSDLAAKPRVPPIMWSIATGLVVTTICAARAGLPIVLHPDDPTNALEAAHGVRLRAGAIDLIVAEGTAPGAPPGDAGCGEVRFSGVVLGLPCAPAAAVGTLGVVAAPLDWTSPDGAGVELIVVDAAEGEGLEGGGARPVVRAPLGMGRAASMLPRDRAWADALWAAVPRGTPAGARGLWIALRRAGAWVPIEESGATPRQGPFVRLLAYTVRDGPPPPLWTFPD